MRFYIIYLLLVVAEGLIRLPSIGSSPKIRSQTLQNNLFSDTLLLNVEKITIEAYEAGGIDPTIVGICFALVGVAVIIPKLARSRQISKNSREPSLEDLTMLSDRYSRIETIESNDIDDANPINKYRKDD